MRILALLTFGVLAALGTVRFAQAQSSNPARVAAEKSLALLQKSAAEYTVHRKCFSCHHQAMPVLAITTAQQRGFDINAKELKRQLQFTADFLAKNRENYQMGKGQGGQADTAGYALLTLAAGGWNADATTSAVVEYLLQRDKTRDHWLPVSNRPPSEASHFTTTYLALHALQKYPPADKQQQADARLEKARNWLMGTPARDTEDRVFRLFALKLSGADAKSLKTAAKELAASQRKDGGWAQLDRLGSDAYATGSALVALHQAGALKTQSAIYQRGVKFLLMTQLDDGSWHIASRSKPFQTYFESGFPHGNDQFISSAATSWAAMALILASEPVFKQRSTP